MNHPSIFISEDAISELDAFETDRGLVSERDLFLPEFQNKQNSDLKQIFWRIIPRYTYTCQQP